VAIPVLVPKTEPKAATAEVAVQHEDLIELYADAEVQADISIHSEHVAEPAPVKEAVICEDCGGSFVSKSNMMRHRKHAHLGGRSKYLKHIKKGKKFVCAVCEKEYGHSEDLKKHYIKNHHLEHLKEKNVRIEPLIDALAKRGPAPELATDTHNVFEEQKTL
jgi:hypothetical protein